MVLSHVVAGKDCRTRSHDHDRCFCLFWGLQTGYIGIMEEKMETTTL